MTIGKNIRLRIETYEKLAKLRKEWETPSDVIARLIKTLEEK